MASKICSALVAILAILSIQLANGDDLCLEQTLCSQSSGGALQLNTIAAGGCIQLTDVVGPCQLTFNFQTSPIGTECKSTGVSICGPTVEVLACNKQPSITSPILYTGSSLIISNCDIDCAMHVSGSYYCPTAPVKVEPIFWNPNFDLTPQDDTIPATPIFAEGPGWWIFILPPVAVAVYFSYWAASAVVWKMSPAVYIRRKNAESPKVLKGMFILHSGILLTAGIIFAVYSNCSSCIEPTWVPYFWLTYPWNVISLALALCFALELALSVTLLVIEGELSYRPRSNIRFVAWVWILLILLLSMTAVVPGFFSSDELDLVSKTYLGVILGTDILLLIVILRTLFRVRPGALTDEHRALVVQQT